MFSMYLTVYYIFYKAALTNFQQDVNSLQIGNIRVNDIHTVCMYPMTDPTAYPSVGLTTTHTIYATN